MVRVPCRGLCWWESNVQVGVTVRKGVGGTCPARAAARGLSRCGLLQLLLDPGPPVAPRPAADPSAATEASPVPTQQPLAVSPLKPTLACTAAPVLDCGSMKEIQVSNEAGPPQLRTPQPHLGSSSAAYRASSWQCYCIYTC